VATILRGDSDDLLVLLGMKCSSWSRVNQGTSMRQPCCPDGDSSKKSVFTANCMAARTAKIGLSELHHIFVLVGYTVTGIKYRFLWNKHLRTINNPLYQI
jgi:hypothetical protein